VRRQLLSQDPFAQLAGDRDVARRLPLIRSHEAESTNCQNHMVYTKNGQCQFILDRRSGRPQAVVYATWPIPRSKA
jgi:hypothetical protein